MANITIVNRKHDSKIDKIKLEGVENGSIKMLVEVNGEPQEVHITLNDAQLMQSWLFLTIKDNK